MKISLGVGLRFLIASTSNGSLLIIASLLIVSSGLTYASHARPHYDLERQGGLRAANTSSGCSLHSLTSDPEDVLAALKSPCRPISILILTFLLTKTTRS